MYFTLCWLCLCCKLIRCSEAKSASHPFSIILHHAWHDARQSEYSIRADREEATEVRSIWSMGLSRVRKILREGNWDALFNSLKDEPGSPEWMLALRQGTSQDSRVRWCPPRPLGQQNGRCCSLRCALSARF